MDDFDWLDEKAEVVTVEPYEGASWEYLAVNGITFPKLLFDYMPLEDFADHLRRVKDMEIRDDDVLIVSYPRSGTHWLFETVSMLLRGSSDYKRTDKNCEYLDLISVDQPASMPSPRVLSTHHLPRNLPRGVIKKGTKIVHIRRNPKDVLVSLFHLLMNNWPKGCSVDTLDQFVTFFTGGFGVYFIASWADQVKAWEQFSKQRPGQVLNVSYEDMIQDAARETRRISDFLKCDHDDVIIRDIADACSFAKLKAFDTEKQKAIPMEHVHRKGRVGGWKDELTVAQNERLDQWLEKNLVDTDLTFTYEL